MITKFKKWPTPPHWCSLLLVALILLAPWQLRAQKLKDEPLILNKGPHLFIDNFLIEEASFLTRVVNNPIKLEKPILYGGMEKDEVFQPYLSVIRDQQIGRFRMWYNTPVKSYNRDDRSLIGYIESKDGIHWSRPHKALEYPQEIQFGVSVIDRGADYKNPNERYVFAYYLKPGFRISTSPDGFTWNSISDEPVFLHNHDITSLHWDPIRKHYMAFVSQVIGGFEDSSNPGTDDERRRIPHQTVSKDLMHWEPIWPIIMPKIGVPKEKGETQFYSMSGVVARGDLLVGLVKVLRDDLNATYGKDAKAMGDMGRKAAGIGYTVLAWSHDGRTWQRDYIPFIPNNPIPGSFDHAMAWGDEQIVVGEETFIYYGGYERGHKINRFEERHIGLARMPRDRYVSRDAGLNFGTLITKPLIINAGSITINANVQGECRVRLLNVNREPLDGFGWVELKGDSIEHKVGWNKKLNSISGKAVYLEFQLKNAQLFGFDLH